ncbi:pyridoxal phosphate-dependent aminotransferase [Nocardia vulneris]|uniref:pyridoxal phosphate-dependent aminotransferase n=1 Tax=Nocardia vulneris TaxID=1141657 RepID=UPI0030D122BC
MTDKEIRTPSRRTLGAERVGRLPSGGLAALLHTDGIADLVNLAVGTPGFPAPAAALTDAASAALRSGAHQYADPAGLLALRTRIAAGLPDTPDPETELTVTVGGSEGLAVALLSSVDPGDEVVVLEPFYENFLGAIALSGGIPRFVRLRGPHWLPDPGELAAAFGPRTRAIILNSPGNPTGTVLPRALLEQVAVLCEKWDVTAVSDEVYAPFVYDHEHHCSVASVAGLAERSIVIGSLSKSHAVSGWRLGFLRARPPWTRLLRAVHVATTVCASTPLQHAAASVELFGPWLHEVVAEMRARRNQATALLREAGFRCAPPRGGCYILADTQAVSTSASPALAQTLAARCGVLIAPATAFYAQPADGNGHVRVAFNRSEATLAIARARLAAFSTGAGHDHRSIDEAKAG